MIGSAKDSIDMLKKAQVFDREIYVAEQQRKSIPEERAKLKSDLELEKNRLRDLEADLKKMQMKQKEREGDLASKENNIKKLDGQLSQVKTNKEYSALQQEIASLKADNSLLEEEIIKVIDQVEAAEEEVKREKERLKQIEKDFAAREAELNQKEKTIADSLQGIINQREDIMKQVAPEARALYDLIIKKKQGLALVKVNGESCGACQLLLRPQLINEIRMSQSLVVCENCSRILYFEE
jgi:uncharacterized protein